MALFKKRKITLALGGGAARGIANIGVLKVLEEERIPIDFVIGTSIGGLIGASYCLGVPTYRMEKAALSFTLNKLADFSISKQSLMKGKKLANLITEFTDKKKFSDAQIPFAITTTNIETGEELVHTKGNLQRLLQASCSWPGIFPPVTVEGKKLTDGGIRNSIPVKTAKHLGATKIIAVDIGFCPKYGKLDNLFQLFIQSVQILGEELDSYQSKQADIVIKPNLKDIDQFSFHRANDALRAGETAAHKAIKEIRKKLRLEIGLWNR